MKRKSEAWRSCFNLGRQAVPLMKREPTGGHFGSQSRLRRLLTRDKTRDEQLKTGNQPPGTRDQKPLP